MAETVHCVYCSKSPLPLSDHNTNDTISSLTIHQRSVSEPYWVTFTLRLWYQGISDDPNKYRCHQDNNSAEHAAITSSKRQNVKTTCARFISQVTFPSWSVEANPNSQIRRLLWMCILLVLLQTQRPVSKLMTYKTRVLKHSVDHKKQTLSWVMMSNLRAL